MQLEPNADKQLSRFEQNRSIYINLASRTDE